MKRSRTRIVLEYIPVQILKGMNWIVYKMLDFIRWCRHDK